MLFFRSWRLSEAIRSRNKRYEEKLSSKIYF